MYCICTAPHCRAFSNISHLLQLGRSSQRGTSPGDQPSVCLVSSEPEQCLMSASSTSLQQRACCEHAGIHTCVLQHEMLDSPLQRLYVNKASSMALHCRALLGSLIWMLRWISSGVQASPRSEGEGEGGASSPRAPRSARPKTPSLVG